MNEVPQWYALVANETGALWWVGQASDPEEACGISDLKTGGESFEYVARETLEPGEVGYLVYEVPAGFSAREGTLATLTAGLQGCPLAGTFARIDL